MTADDPRVSEAFALVWVYEREMARLGLAPLARLELVTILAAGAVGDLAPAEAEACLAALPQAVRDALAGRRQGERLRRLAVTTPAGHA